MSFFFYRVDCLFSNTPFLEVSLTPEVLLPGGCMEVLFTFYPRETVHYHEKVVFDINGCAKQVVEILGQGIEMKVRKKTCLVSCERSVTYVFNAL